MPIPDFQSIMLPLLRFAADKQEHTLAEAREVLAEEFELSNEERSKLLPSGRQRTFDNRVAWAKVYLQRAGLVDGTKRAHFQITQRGLSVLQEAPNKINIRFLQKYPEFVAFRTPRDNEKKHEHEKEDEHTPEENLEDAYQKLRTEIEADILHHIKDLSPSAFEKLA